MTSSANDMTFVCRFFATSAQLFVECGTGFASVVNRGGEEDHWQSQCHTRSLAELRKTRRTLSGRANGTRCLNPEIALTALVARFPLDDLDRFPSCRTDIFVVVFKMASQRGQGRL